jgi:alpha-galactosidase
VLAVNQDALGKPAKRVFEPGFPAEVWVRELADGAKVVGLFNRTDKPVTMEYNWHAEGFASSPQVRDLWRRQDLPKTNVLSADLPPHGSMLLRVK